MVTLFSYLNVMTNNNLLNDFRKKLKYTAFLKLDASTGV